MQVGSVGGWVGIPGCGVYNAGFVFFLSLTLFLLGGVIGRDKEV